MSSIESVEFVADEFDEFDVKPDVEALFDHRQFGDPLQVRLAALAIRPSPSSSSSSMGDQAGPSRVPEPRGVHLQGQSRIPAGDLGPADPPKRRGRPKGSKSQPRVAFSLEMLPERREKIRAERRLAEVSLK